MEQVRVQCSFLLGWPGAVVPHLLPFRAALCSSSVAFLMLPIPHTHPMFLCFPPSLVRWPSSEALLSWPDLLSDPSIMGNTIQKLKRGRASRHLGLEAPLAAEEDSLSLSVHQGQPRYFSASGEAGSTSLWARL